MEIECKGCYYTLCSFVCLTEDLSEILKFLWRHGCLRKSYLCEKCGRKCAIGDKDLFFRCNRNALDSSVIPQKVENLPAQINTRLISCQQTPSQTQANGSTQTTTHQQSGQISHHQYIISQPNSSKNEVVSIQNSNPGNLILLDCDNRLPQSEILNNNESIQNDTVSLTVVPNAILTPSEFNPTGRILTVIGSQGNQVVHSTNQNNPLVTREDQNVHIPPNIQAHLVTSNHFSFGSKEPSEKICKKLLKTQSGKTPKKRCNFKVSMKKGTFFEKSKLPIDTVCKFVVFWCCMKHPTQEFLRNELSLATRTVVDWSTACREICIHWAKSVSEKIGGDGVMVQVDEVKIQDSKESKPNDVGSKFSFWGMEKDKEKGKIFIVPVSACDPWSLLTVINDWVLPGSVIISNCWKAYDCLKLQEFIELTFVQSKTFVHPQSNGGQQNFDGRINEAGASAGGELQMPRFGTRRSHHLGDLAEFMFKRRYSNHLERMHAFFKQISLAYPLH